MEPIQVALIEHLEQLISSGLIDSELSETPIFVAYSGGLDSTVLLHAAAHIQSQKKINSVVAAHVNHGLQTENNHWQQFCQATCQGYQIPCKVKVLNLAQQNRFSESAAREFRYEFFEELLKDSGVMMFAHHLDDQVETLLFRMIRGSGVHGLTGIPKQRALGGGQLIRPLLPFTRQQLRNYAEKHQLKWVEDPSNRQDHYSRNYIRNQVLPLINEQWPSARHSLYQLSQVASDQVAILDEVACQDLENVSEQPTIVSVEKLKLLTIPRIRNLLHFWVRQQSKESPSSMEITELVRQIQSAKVNALEVKAASGWVRGYNDKLYFRHCSEPSKLENPVTWTDVDSSLETENGFVLAYHPWTSDSQLQIRKPSADEVVTVVGRTGGEVARPTFREHSCELKKIYQELKVPHWERVWLPVIYYNDQIAAVPGVFVDRSFAVEQQGYSLQLHTTPFVEN